ncbi:hypothetical protein [Flavobacterium sp.]|uniref:hypothetical protein n=1 Tax=Flavobacterium sp. TaxID=239 RepID=UPI0039E2263E
MKGSKRRYVAPSWNLRHIWGQPGSLLPGVPFLEAQFELLYGLNAHLKPEDTHIAELASKLGEIPVPPANSVFWETTAIQDETFSEAWHNYLAFYRAWKSRVAVLEPSKENAFGRAKFSEKLKYSPRIDFRSKLQRPVTSTELENDIIEELNKLLLIVTAEDKPAINQLIADTKALQKLIAAKDETAAEKYKSLRTALAANEKTSEIAQNLSLYERIGASLRYPIHDGSEIPENGKIDPKDLSILEKKIKFSHDKNGLAGGFHYGFESKEIYKEFWREAFKGGSSSGELEAPAYSSVGGWGKQTARFAGDKTIIKSTTTMGRTHFYAVERIGRIGVLWHKAKHVIEYERTVVPSAYFPHQPKLHGRPIVRKVREYIEILEPIKKYPDFEGHSDDAPGSIQACHFKSIIIPVRSSWGKDVAFNVPKLKPDGTAEPGSFEYQNFGWEIPLWHPDADPKLFPKPQVSFELIAPAESNVSSVMVNLSEPQHLRFYTDTREKVNLSDTAKEVMLTADTSKWPAIKYVDYTDLPLPSEKHLAPSLANDSGKNMELQMPDVLEVPPGFERYTFKVDTSELPSGVANRYNPKSGISGKMKSVTMMRKPVFTEKDRDENGQEIKPKPVCVTFETLVSAPESLLNRVYNAGPNIVKEITEVFTRDVIKDHKLAPILKKLNNEKPVTLKHFKALYENHRPGHFPTKYLWKEAVSSSEGMLNNLLALYTEQSNHLKKEIDLIVAQGGDFKDEAIAALRRYQHRIGALHLKVDIGIEFFASLQGQLETGLQAVEKQAREEKNKITQFISEEEARIQTLIDDAETDFEVYKNKVVAALDTAIQNSDKLLEALDKLKLPGKTLNDLKAVVKEKISGVKTACSDLKDAIGTLTDIDAVREAVTDLKAEIINHVANFEALLKDLIKQIETFEKEEFKKIQDFLNAVKDSAKDIEQEVIAAIEVAIKDIEVGWENAKGEISSRINKLNGKVRKWIDADSDSFKACLAKILYKDDNPGYDSVFGILKTIDGWIDQLLAYFKTNYLAQFSEFTDEAKVKEWLSRYDEYKQLETAIANGNTEQILKLSTALANRISPELGQLAAEAAEKIQEINRTTESFNAMRNSGQQVLDNYRSVWGEFTAPGMGLNRKTVAMIVNKDWKEVEQRLSITPCISRVKQFENDLEGLGLRTPVTNILEGLLPPKPEWVQGVGDYSKSLLNKFNFSDVLSDVGAMRLDKLFPNFKMPNNLRDNIKVTQGFDKQNLLAWVNAEIDFKLDAPQSILAIGPIDVKLNEGKFTARVRMEMDIEGNTKKQNSGMLAGDWETNIGGVPIMTFKEAKAIFEGDKLTFDLDPNRMEMPGLLKLLTDASKNIPAGAEDGAGDGKQSPFKIGLIEMDGQEIHIGLAGRKLPIGVKASLDIPPINVGGGTTAMTNLSFGGHFALQFWDIQKKKFGFMTALGFYLGKQDAPFNFTAFILGGGGYVKSDIMFKPQEGLSVVFVMSVHASVGFALSVGWMSGSILILMGLEGEYHKTPDAESTVYVSIFVQIIGTVNLMGLVSVYLGLRLAATYNGSQLTGKGQVKLKIKICWCLTVKVDKQYQKTFAGNNEKKRIEQPKEEAVKISNTLS